MFLETKFQETLAAVASNDSKYQINKGRAKKYARNTAAALRWSAAKDVASCEALRAGHCDKARKIRCLGAKIIVYECLFPLHVARVITQVAPIS